MRVNFYAAAALAVLALGGCSKSENTDGNGPGDADGAGGKTDSAVTTPATQPQPDTSGAAPGSTATDSVPPPVESTGDTANPPPSPPPP